MTDSTRSKKTTESPPEESLSGLLKNFEELSALWRKTGSAASFRRLIRLALLRKIQNQIHSERSFFLTEGEKDKSRAIGNWENRIQTLRDSPLLGSFDGELPAFLASASAQDAPDSGRIPDALLEIIEKRKLERYDRFWEKTLAIEAYDRGWRFWQMTAVVEIHQVEKWNHFLERALWPEGIILFVESGETSSSGFSSGFTSGPAPLCWRGSWVLLLSPSLHPASGEWHGIVFNCGDWPGYTGLAPEWQLLLAPEGPRS